MEESLSFRMPARQRGATRLIIIGVIAVVIALLAGGLGGYFLFSGAKDDATETETADADKQPPPEPTFVTVKPMTVNLASDARVLYIGLSLNVADEQTAEQLESHMPEVRNRMLIELSDHQAESLTTSSGKQQIADTLAETLRQPYSPEGEPVAINQVLFTNFIVQ